MNLFSSAGGGSPSAFASFDLDSLTTSAARLRPERLALVDSAGARLTYAELDAQSATLAAHLAEMGLAGGERLLIAGGARASSVIALIAGLRCGLDTALAPAHLLVDEMSEFARAVGAVALAGEAHYGELSLIEGFFAVAAAAPDVRLVCCLGGDADGAVELDIGRLEPRPAPPRLRPPGECAVIAWQGGPARAHTQHSLVAAALELLSRARIGMRDPIISTLAPTSFGALAAGPFAALLAGCALHLHGPFEGAQFLAEFDACAPAHLVAPRALALALDGHAAMRTLASLILSGGAPADARSLAAQTMIPVINLDGLGAQAFDALAGARQSPKVAREETSWPAPATMRAAYS